MSDTQRETQDPLNHTEPAPGGVRLGGEPSPDASPNPDAGAEPATEQNATDDRTPGQRLRDLARQARCLLWESTVYEVPFDDPHCVLNEGEFFDPKHFTGLHWDMHYIDEQAARNWIKIPVPLGESFINLLYMSRDEDSRRMSDRASWSAIRSGANSYQSEFSFRPGDGQGGFSNDSSQWLWFSDDVSIEPTVTEPGIRQWQLYGVSIDITEQKRAELEREAAEAERIKADQDREAAIAEWELAIAERESAIAEREAAIARLRQTADELTRSNEALRDLAQAASQELTAPLREIHTLGESLEQTRQEQVRQEQEDVPAVGTLLIAKDAKDAKDKVRVPTPPVPPTRPGKPAPGRGTAVTIGAAPASAQPASAETQGLLERVTSAAARVQGLMDNLRTYSRLTTVNASPFVPTDLNFVLQDVKRDLENETRKTKGTVERPASLPMVWADPTQIRHLLHNLVQNGLRYRREGVPPIVTVTAQVLPGEREPNAGPNAPIPEWLHLTVSDNGIGFDTSRPDNMGMGLTICKRVAERHGGHITVDTNPSGGSRFTLHIPRRPRQGGGGR